MRLTAAFGGSCPCTFAPDSVHSYRATRIPTRGMQTALDALSAHSTGRLFFFFFAACRSPQYNFPASDPRSRRLCEYAVPPHHILQSNVATFISFFFLLYHPPAPSHTHQAYQKLFESANAGFFFFPSSFEPFPMNGR